MNFVEAKYSQLMESLPSLIDEAGAVVSKAVATSNMLGFTLVGGFITGAVLDSLALVMLNPNSLSHAVTLIVTDKYYQGVLHWLWWYAFGFSGMFPHVIFLLCLSRFLFLFWLFKFCGGKLSGNFPQVRGCSPTPSSPPN